jgi:predicted TIM-barrel fold metal-dependent hydrolase
MPLIVDFHTHVFPDPISKYTPSRGVTAVADFRKKARKWLKPVTHSLHAAQTLLRILPEKLRRPVDEVATLAPLAGLLLESTARDLREAMLNAGIDYAVVIAHPSALMNEELLKVCTEHPQFIPVVNIPYGTERPGQVLKNFVRQGARALKIHAAMDKDSMESPRYRALLKAASECQLPVILHTGCFHSHLLYKDPEHARAEKFENWFKTYPEIKFVLAHMNLHEPEIAIDLGEKYRNVLVDTSWQPSETIGEAVRRLGAEKVLFGTDWPLVGNNIDVGISRIQDCIETGTLTKSESELILGKNAQCLLNLPN